MMGLGVGGAKFGSCYSVDLIPQEYLLEARQEEIVRCFKFQFPHLIKKI